MIQPITYPALLPIVTQKDKIIKAIEQNRVIIISGETGSGKTTQLPKMCLEAGRGRKKKIGCTQPRRIAATAMAARVAEELGEHGNIVGYKIRFKDETGRQTRIKFMTDGILLAETQQNNSLSGYDTLIIDEAHERSLNIDFLLGYLKRLLLKRADLKLIISSATIDTEKFSHHFKKAPVIKVSGRTYPVEVRYRPPEIDSLASGESSHIEQAVRAVHELRRHDAPGDILIFMPTERDIRETIELLARDSGPHNVKRPQSAWSERPAILPLYGRLSAVDQKKIFKSYRGQKIVVATNVAETSLTVPGIRYIVDTGLARISTYNARARTTSLPVAPISRASCDQRQGRCGRVAPGVCIRLYSEDNFNNRPEFTPPEIRRSDLAGVILKMIALKLGDPASFPFIDPPTRRSIMDGYALLTELGAVAVHRQQELLTPKGEIMARLPLDPRIACLIIEARKRKVLREVMIIAAALTIQDPRIRPAGKESLADEAHARFAVPSSDFMSFLVIWDLFHKTQNKVKSRSRIRKFCASHFLSYQRIREWQDIHQQIRMILQEEGDLPPAAGQADYERIHQVILSGYLRNIGVKKSKNIYQGTRGKELMIFPGSAQFNKSGNWIMAAELVETTKLFARTVAMIKPEWLEPIAGPLCISSVSRPRWEKKRGQVVADEKVTLFGLIIVPARRINYSGTGPDARREAREIFIQSALVEGELGGSRCDFLNHNQRLLDRLVETENRLRQRGFVADDSTLYAFYDQRLGDVCTRSELHAFLKKTGGDLLKMTADDLVIKSPAADILAEFPGSLTIDQFSFKLSYKFAPGTMDDGVSIYLPVDLPLHLPHTVFQWLVPGFLPQKIEFLLKGLPKGTRKKLVPIKNTVQDILKVLPLAQGSLYRALEQVVFQKYGVKINKTDWPDPPDHLMMRFVLHDSTGKIVGSGRDLTRLIQPDPARPLRSGAGPIPDCIRNIWEKEKITAWDFKNLPEKIPCKEKNRLSGFAYPGLIVDQAGILGLRLFASPAEARTATRNNLPILYGLYFPNHFKNLQKECRSLFKDKTSGWHLYEGIAGRQQTREAILTFIMQEIFACRNGRIPDQETFAAKLDSLKSQGMFAMGMKVLESILTALRARRLTIDHINDFAAKAGGNAAPPVVRNQFAEYREQLAGIMPANFLETFTGKHLQQIERYCKGLRIRIERAHAAYDKDAGKAAQVARHIERFQKLQVESPAEECLQHLDDYRMMLEEFKISLFAQELKTIIPVSAKRLDKKWREIEKSCC